MDAQDAYKEVGGRKRMEAHSLPLGYGFSSGDSWDRLVQEKLTREKYGGSCAIRTRDHRIKSAVLYQLS